MINGCPSGEFCILICSRESTRMFERFDEVHRHNAIIIAQWSHWRASDGTRDCEEILPRMPANLNGRTLPSLLQPRPSLQ